MVVNVNLSYQCVCLMAVYLQIMTRVRLSYAISSLSPLSPSAGANVLLFNEGRIVKLTDFGSAVRLDEAQGCQIRSNKGLTPNFSAPEVYLTHSRTLLSIISLSSHSFLSLCLSHIIIFLFLSLLSSPPGHKV